MHIALSQGIQSGAAHRTPETEQCLPGRNGTMVGEHFLQRSRRLVLQGL